MTRRWIRAASFASVHQGSALTTWPVPRLAEQARRAAPRKVIARMLASAGDDIAEADLNPPITPRRI
jgi:hypothetical protein